MSRILTWIMGFFFRWFPHCAEPGLHAVGRPGPHSPVLVTCNYALTLARLRRALKGRNAWILAARSGGINVWCAACGGHFGTDPIIDAVITSRLAQKVVHRTLMLPPLAAPSTDRKAIREATGFTPRFGPVRARDIGGFLDAGWQKTGAMCRADYGIHHRLDMLVSMNFVIYLGIALVFGLVRPQSLTAVSVLFWALAAAAYLLFPLIPGRTGWRKALSLAVLAAGAFALAGGAGREGIFSLWPWMIGSTVLSFTIGFDLGGIAGPIPSDAEAALQRLGIRKMGWLLNFKVLAKASLDTDLCGGCGTCVEICPLGLFSPGKDSRKSILENPARCFSCGACAAQCPTKAITLSSE